MAADLIRRDERTIPLALVRHAAFLAGSGRKWLPQPAARWAAMTGRPLEGSDCWTYRHSASMVKAPSLVHMTRGNLDRLAQRVCRTHGYAAARRIWGVSLTVLKHEAAQPMRHG